MAQEGQPQSTGQPEPQSRTGCWRAIWPILIMAVLLVVGASALMLNLNGSPKATAGSPGPLITVATTSAAAPSPSPTAQLAPSTQPSDTPTSPLAAATESATQAALPTSPSLDETRAAIAQVVQDTLTAFAAVPTPTLPTAVALVGSTPVINGEVDPFAPSRLALGEVGVIRVEIRMNPLATPPGGGTPIFIPTMSPTPVLGTPQPTPTPLPTVPSQYTAITECMEAELVGVSLDNFDVNPSPQRVMRQFQLVATPPVLQVAWWQWSIKAKGDQALGKNSFDVQIYHGQKVNGRCESSPDVPANSVHIEIEVYRTAVQLFDPILQAIISIAGAIAAVGGAAGVLYGLFKFLRDRSKKPTTK